MKDPNQDENMFREFERIKNTNKELLMYLSVLAEMVDCLMKKNDAYQFVEDQSQLKMFKGLVHARSIKPNLGMVELQEISRDYVLIIFFKFF